MIKLNYISEYKYDNEKGKLIPSLIIQLRLRGDDIIYMYKNWDDTVQVGVKFSSREFTVSNSIDEIEKLIELDQSYCSCRCSKDNFYDVPAVFPSDAIYNIT